MYRTRPSNPYKELLLKQIGACHLRQRRIYFENYLKLFQKTYSCLVKNKVHTSIAIGTPNKSEIVKNRRRTSSLIIREQERIN